MLYGPEETSELIRQGTPLLVAGSAEMLRQLPKGNWIGGTTPSLFTETGGVSTKELLLVTVLPKQAKLVCIQRYGVGGLHLLVPDAPDNGFSIVIFPTGTMVHHTFAKEAPAYPGIYTKAITGWASAASGGHFGGIPHVFYGPEAHCLDDEAVAIHMELPKGLLASVEMINVYRPGSGPIIRFESDGFIASQATVDGTPVVFADYLDQIKADLNVPIVADYCGMFINISIKNYDLANRQVRFYGPVFHNVDYRFATQDGNLMAKIRASIPRSESVPVFSCICTANYSEGNLENYATGSFCGPVAHGEIAHILVNQSITCLRIYDESGQMLT